MNDNSTTNPYTKLQHRVPSPPFYDELQRTNIGTAAVQSEASAPAVGGDTAAICNGRGYENDITEIFFSAMNIEGNWCIRYKSDSDYLLLLTEQN